MLKTFLEEDEKYGIPERAQSSRFIVDEKHSGEKNWVVRRCLNILFTQVGGLAYQFQCVVTHLGQCVHVSEAERPATHDMTVYRRNRTQRSAGLLAKGMEEIVMLADQGYKCELPELFVPNKPNRALNGRRSIVENYFGRMTNALRIVGTKLPFGYDMINPFLKALCFLTNISILRSPLRRNEYMLHRAFMECRRKKHEERRMRTHLTPLPRVTTATPHKTRPSRSCCRSQVQLGRP